MPRVLNVEEEIKSAEAVAKTDPSHRFHAATKIVAHAYLSLLRECAETGKPLSHSIEAAIVGYYRLKSQAAGLTLSETAMTILQMLTKLWACDEGEAIRIFLEKAGQEFLQKEIAQRNAQKKELQKLAGSV